MEKEFIFIKRKRKKEWEQLKKDIKKLYKEALQKKTIKQN
tara:strand:- start:727 stop:846 length:120 start_codon:yes stop_codon:yes gene_type:complete